MESMKEDERVRRRRKSMRKKNKRYKVQKGEEGIIKVKRDTLTREFPNILFRFYSGFFCFRGTILSPKLR